MSVIDYLSSGGMGSIGGDLPEEERKDCNSIVKSFGEALRNYARQLQVPASLLNVLKVSFLFIARDTSNYYFVFIDKPGMNTLNYRDLSSHGFVPLQTLINQARIEVGEVIWAFQIPIGLAKLIDENMENNLAKQYIDTTLQALKKEEKKVSHEALATPEIGPYIDSFRKDYPSNVKTAFIMMQFSQTPIHNKIVSIIKDILKRHNIIGLRADDKEYSDDLFNNIRTYMHCSDFGIAIFERILEDDFNPNVSLEVGYMMGLGRQVCFIKDKTLRQLHSDLVGKLYKPVDLHDIDNSIPQQLEKWLSDRGII